MAVLSTNWRPNDKQLKSFGCIAFVVFGGIAGCIFWQQSFWGREMAAATANGVALGLAIAAALCLGLSFVRPRVLLPLYWLLMAISYPIGFVISNVVLFVIFMLLLTPLGLLKRAFGRDPLARSLDRQAQSYWIERSPPPPAERYFRQY
ncbi:MAG: hypothetical protein H6707_17945 [Deltaproteobacteria bacterium]|nr:hypothetical protein [Deltaproteobacteria bacterium]